MPFPDHLLDRAASHARAYLATVDDRPVRQSATPSELRAMLGAPLGAEGDDPARVLDLLAEAARIGSVATQGPRFFGFVIGGSVPVATAADWLVSAWDQNGGVHVLSPLVAVAEQVASGWVKDVLGLGAEWSAGFVTGGQMANFTGLAAGRHHVLKAAGWDVEADGLQGAPPVEVIVGDEAHYTIFNALRLLGLGSRRVRRVSIDAQGRMDPAHLARVLRETSGPCLVCAQAGNVNTGAFDPLPEITAAARERGAWVHVDGAFGLWAAASPGLRHLVAGIEHADSLATDAHKWLNVPYDCGIALSAHQASHRAAMTQSAAYIMDSPLERDPHEFVPEESRRARVIPLYAAMRTLGTDGLRALVERCCALARRFADGLRQAGYEVLNDVVLNQVMVDFGGADVTRTVIGAVQDDGTCWAGGTTYQGRVAMRISVSSYKTTEADVDRSLAAMLRCAQAARSA